ncbi:MAG: M50 family metallopeptidase [Parcubacteria group bacterium]|nr:M50 family metallopeptidase [Parcubacteria group bacterium]
MQKNNFTMLLIASVATVILWFIPFAEIITYPLLIFATIIHEMCHAIVTLLTGGSVVLIQINTNGSGVTWTSGGMPILIGNAGYLGTITYGGWMLMLCKNARQATIALIITVSFIFITTILFIRPLISFGFLFGIFFTIATVLCIRFFSQSLLQLCMSFLSLQLVLNGFSSLRTVTMIALTVKQNSDAVDLEQATLIPAYLWTFFWIALSFFVLLFVAKNFKKSFSQ